MRKIRIADIREFLERPVNVRRMLEAADRGRPPVEPLQHDLLDEFGQGVKQDWVKMRIGRETKYIMERNGYRHAEYSIPVTGPVFTVASVYVKA